MKLVIVTAIEAFEKKVAKLFKAANIQNFSSSEIDGYKNASPLLVTSSWFSGEKSGNESCMFFSFTEEENINKLFELIEEFNKNLKTENPLRAVVLPIEKSI